MNGGDGRGSVPFWHAFPFSECLPRSLGPLLGQAAKPLEAQSAVRPSVKPLLFRTPVNPSQQKYSTLPKFGNGVSLRYPGSSLRGDLVSSCSRAGDAVDAAALGTRGAGRADSPCEPETACRRAALSGSSRQQFFGNVDKAEEYCGVPASRAYGKTVWSWPSLLRSSFRGGGIRVNRRGVRDFRGSEGGQNELGSRESTA